MIVSDRPAPKHRIAGAIPSKHRYEDGHTCPETGQVHGRTDAQFVAVNLIKVHGGSLTAIRTRRAAR